MRFCLGIHGSCVVSVNKVIWNKGAQAALGGVHTCKRTHTCMHTEKKRAWTETLEDMHKEKNKTAIFRTLCPMSSDAEQM